MAKRQQLLFELVYKEKEQQREQVSSAGQEISARNSDVKYDTARPSKNNNLYIKFNTSGIILGVVVLCVIFFCGYILGFHIGRKSSIEKRSQAQLAQIQNQQPRTEALKVTPLPVKKVVSIPQINNHRNVNSSEMDIKKLPNNKKFVRKKGTNYLIIQLFKDFQSAERARKFLADNGVHATIEKLGKRYALTSVAGFDLRDPRGRRQAEAFREQIKALGRRYRRQKGANGVDFQTCFYRKWK